MLTKWLSLASIGFILCNAPAQGENRFSLPPNKTAMVNCQIEALALHPGRIISTKTLLSQTDKPVIHFVLKDKAAIDWLVICDGLNGKILKVTNLDERKHN